MDRTFPTITHDFSHPLLWRIIVSVLCISMGSLLGGLLAFDAWRHGAWFAFAFSLTISLLMIFAGIGVAIMGLNASVTLTQDTLVLDYQRKKTTIPLRDIQSISGNFDGDQIWIKTIQGKKHYIDHAVFPSYDAQKNFTAELTLRWNLARPPSSSS